MQEKGRLDDTGLFFVYLLKRNKSYVETIKICRIGD